MLFVYLKHILLQGQFIIFVKLSNIIKFCWDYLDIYININSKFSTFDQLMIIFEIAHHISELLLWYTKFAFNWCFAETFGFEMNNIVKLCL